ncbi:unnamed protein product [Lactuca saligna]|uniref:Uncharacterized protein n=1 Tax=Lactuca saligna TaxID=75948 RepID=A0AA36EB13_LACSI|nr:unnamed protein product [Lactuca saligna]
MIGDWTALGQKPTERPYQGGTTKAKRNRVSVFFNFNKRNSRSIARSRLSPAFARPKGKKIEAAGKRRTRVVASLRVFGRTEGREEVKPARVSLFPVRLPGARSGFASRCGLRGFVAEKEEYECERGLFSWLVRSSSTQEGGGSIDEWSRGRTKVVTRGYGETPTSVGFVLGGFKAVNAMNSRWNGFNGRITGTLLAVLFRIKLGSNQ